MSVAAGVLVIALAAVSTATSPPPCGPLPSHYPPIVAFELARDRADLADLFGDGRRRLARCRHRMVTSMDTLNTADLALFIPAYGTFLIAALLGLRRRGRPFTGTGIALVAVAMAADVAEDVCLLALTPELDPSSGWLAVLPWVSGVKRLALGCAGAAAGLALWSGGRHRVSAALCLFTPLAALAAVVRPHPLGPLAVTGLAACWAIVFLDGVFQARARVDHVPGA